MEAQELRIGNLINYLGNPTKVNSIAGLDKTYVSTLSSGIFHESNFYPIPLTEEWLLKFGYKKDGEFFDNETRLSFWTDKNTFNGILADWADKTIGEVKHVHQLQNLYFALTGCELEINLNNK